MKLNSAQSDAVNYIDGPLLVLAGAGSGKTRVITEKIKYLIQYCNISPSRIFAVTFTNKAAREMQERVNTLMRRKGIKGLSVSTFHTLGLKIIRHECKRFGFKPGFSIFDVQDVKVLLGTIMHQSQEENEIDVEEVQTKISNWKNALITDNQIKNIATDKKDLLAASVYEKYTRTLKAYNAVDFDDLILLPVMLFKQDAQCLDYWQKRVSYMLVDECQDTNNAQYELIKQLTCLRTRFTLVGDDDQSIYAWRGARPENMANLEKDYPGLRVIKLEQNYRSTKRILKVANTLIANNPHVFDKTLWSDLDGGAKIRVVKCNNEEAEAERIAVEILTHRLRHSCCYRDYAILYRSNHQSRLLELKLQEHQLPYFITGGVSLFSRTEVKDILAYLRLIINPDDDNAFLRIINTPRREIGLTTLEKLSTYASKRHITLYNACYEMGLTQVIDSRFVERLQKFVKWMDHIRQRCSTENPVETICEMVDIIGYKQWLVSNSSSSVVAEKRFGNIEILLNSIKVSIEQADEDLTGEEKLKQAIERLMLQDMLDQQDKKDDTDRIQMLTLHASKGLEFPFVYMAGIEEDILPHRNSVEEDSIEEERRLAYVGITRAQKELTVTLSSQRKQFGERILTVPSRFLEEFPQEDLIYEGFDHKPCVKEQTKKGNDMLNLLRDSLNL